MYIKLKIQGDNPVATEDWGEGGGGPPAINFFGNRI